MILVIGGAFQGKAEYLKTLPQYRSIIEQMPPGKLEGQLAADGRTQLPERALSCPVILGFHHYVGRMAEEAAIEVFICRIIKENPRVLITMDEVGCGIVPIDPKERAYRELAGLAGQRLAEQAEQVHRVICGIGSRIK